MGATPLIIIIIIIISLGSVEARLGKSYQFSGRWIKYGMEIQDHWKD